MASFNFADALMHAHHICSALDTAIADSNADQLDRVFKAIQLIMVDSMQIDRRRDNRARKHTTQTLLKSLIVASCIHLSENEQYTEISDFEQTISESKHSLHELKLEQ